MKNTLTIVRRMKVNNSMLYAGIILCFTAIPFSRVHANTDLLPGNSLHASYHFFQVNQNITITGTVLSGSGGPLSGATISVKNSAATTLTDEKGAFSINAPGSAVLIVSYVGYQTKEVSVNGRTSLTISLASVSVDLNEVVVLGYTAQKKSTITGAVGTANMDDLDKRRVADVAQAMQGQLAGVLVVQSTGAPGDPITIRIRGLTTNGNNNPLFIVDGIPTRDVTFLNPADIKSLTVLKDASSAAIYGSRAAAGVVVITTKSGEIGKTRLEVNYYNGIQQAVNLPKMLNATQYMNKMEEAWNNSGYSGTNPYTADKGRTDFANTDWLDELFVLGHSQNLQLTASGGTEKLQYLMSAAYYKQDGIVIFDNDRYQRVDFRTNINANLTNRFTIGTNLQLSYGVQDKLSSEGDAPGIMRHAMIRPPVIPVYKDKNDPSYSERDPYTDLPFYTAPWNSDANRYEFSSNPIALAHFTNDKRRNYKTFGNIYGEYAFLRNKELKFRTTVGIDMNFTHNKAFSPNFGDVDGGGNSADIILGRQNRPNQLTEDRGQEFNFTWNNVLSYNKKIHKHEISALAGSEYISNQSDAISASRTRYAYDRPTFQYIDFGSEATTLDDGTVISDIWNGGGASEWALLSFFGSATYSFDTRYIITGNIRADASSRFGPNNRWGYFPSVSLGWIISEENFMKGVNWLSNLKLRLSTGTLGNQEIDDFAYMTTLRKEGDKYVIKRYGNPDLKWESTRQDNIGLDFGFLKNKLNVSLDYYTKETTGILLPISLPKIAGDVSATIVNGGRVTNKGVEMALTFRNSDNPFKYSINTNLATVKNVAQLDPNFPGLGTKPLNSFYGYQMLGIYQNEKEITDHLYNTLNPLSGVKPGDIKFADLNEDGKINDNDRTFLGNSIPKLSYGLSLSGQYKGFDLSVFFQGVQGVDKYNDLKKITDFDTRPFNHSVRVLDAWHGEGTSNTMPRTTFNDNGSSKTSSIFVEDASYLRLKNLEIGYTLNPASFRSIGIQSIRFYVSTQNLFTITDYTGLDPESTNETTNLLDMGTYPQSRAFLFGVHVNL